MVITRVRCMRILIINQFMPDRIRGYLCQNSVDIFFIKTVQ